eukprot:612159-Pelagomonas_calceolata.AAC.1
MELLAQNACEAQSAALAAVCPSVFHRAYKAARFVNIVNKNGLARNNAHVRGEVLASRLYEAEWYGQ